MPMSVDSTCAVVVHFAELSVAQFHENVSPV